MGCRGRNHKRKGRRKIKEEGREGLRDSRSWKSKNTCLVCMRSWVWFSIPLSLPLTRTHAVMHTKSPLESKLGAKHGGYTCSFITWEAEAWLWPGADQPAPHTETLFRGRECGTKTQDSALSSLFPSVLTPLWLNKKVLCCQEINMIYSKKITQPLANALAVRENILTPHGNDQEYKSCTARISTPDWNG